MLLKNDLKLKQPLEYWNRETINYYYARDTCQNDGKSKYVINNKIWNFMFRVTSWIRQRACCDNRFTHSFHCLYNFGFICNSIKTAHISPFRHAGDNQPSSRYALVTHYIKITYYLFYMVFFIANSMKYNINIIPWKLWNFLKAFSGNQMTLFN